MLDRDFLLSVVRRHVPDAEVTSHCRAGNTAHDTCDAVDFTSPDLDHDFRAAVNAGGRVGRSVAIVRDLAAADPSRRWEVDVERRHIHIQESRGLTNGDAVIAYDKVADESIPLWSSEDGYSVEDGNMSMQSIFRDNSRYGRATPTGGPYNVGNRRVPASAIGGPSNGIFGRSATDSLRGFISGGPDSVEVSGTLGAAPADRLLPLIICDGNLTWKQGPGDKTRVSGDTVVQTMKRCYAGSPIDFTPTTFISPGVPFTTTIVHPDVNATAWYNAVYIRIEPVFQNGVVMTPRFLAEFVGINEGFRPSNYAQYGAANGVHQFAWQDGTKPSELIVLNGHINRLNTAAEPTVCVLENQFDRDGSFAAPGSHTWSATWNTIPALWRIIINPLYLNNLEGQALAERFGLA